MRTEEVSVSPAQTRRRAAYANRLRQPRTRASPLHHAARVASQRPFLGKLGNTQSHNPVLRPTSVHSDACFDISGNRCSCQVSIATTASSDLILLVM